MVILGGLELVAAGYLLKEIHNDSKSEEEQRDRDRERRRRNRRHSRDHHRRHDDSPPSRPSRPSQQSLLPPQSGPQRPYSAPPPQSRPQMMVPPIPVPGAMWQPHPQPQPYPPQQHPPQQYPNQGPSQHGTWPMHPPQNQQQSFTPPYLNPKIQVQQPAASQPNLLHHNNPNNPNFVPGIPRPQTLINLPPPGVHIDMKTGKVQYDMLPPEMKRDLSDPGHANDDGTPPLSRASTTQSFERPRPDAGFAEYDRRSPPQVSQSQPRFTHAAPLPPQGFAELDAETPGRYRAYGNEKSGYGPQQGRDRATSFDSRRSARGRAYRDEEEFGGEMDHGMRSPPPAYRE